MTGRFDRLSIASLSSLSAEDRAVGVAVGAVLVGALGLAVFNPLASDSATAETPARAASVAHVAGEPAHAERSAHKAGAPALSQAAEARREGFKVPPHRVKAKEVIKMAESQVGIREGKGGNTKFHKWYMSTPHAAETAKRDGGAVREYKGASWCNMFVSWVGAQVGAKDMGWDAYTVQHATWFKKEGRWGQKAKPGSVVFFDFKNGRSGGIDGIEHVGFVVKDNGNGTISTVEGNTGDAVKQKIRKKSQVVGYGYPDYSG
ncbi:MULTISPECIES: CHAP domain-containing protein [Actinomadura]|uniref:CHAP domain-containing protein n=1 Tax=Actinomadura litoris TaxID=2678616 RepID=A0A7K1L3H0_9ACTN|nr:MULTISPECIES: CHAP domain-containing protein [Actinomadura]MBT2210193.1 CHAP domain-containing protein [Actinomadura sp. NEAU-AAG7]MUN38971.1 CHAP domain-containing protein [Actinomadura litoris]